jgi:hypothetical protein
MAVPECASNEEIPRVANLSELDFHEEYFLKVPYSIWELVLYFTLPCFFTQNILLFIPIHIGLNVRTVNCHTKCVFLNLHIIHWDILLNKDVYSLPFAEIRVFSF